MDVSDFEIYIDFETFVLIIRFGNRFDALIFSIITHVPLPLMNALRSRGETHDGWVPWRFMAAVIGGEENLRVQVANGTILRAHNHVTGENMCKLVASDGVGIFLPYGINQVASISDFQNLFL